MSYLILSICIRKVSTLFFRIELKPDYDSDSSDPNLALTLGFNCILVASCILAVMEVVFLGFFYYLTIFFVYFLGKITVFSCPLGLKLLF